MVNDELSAKITSLEHALLDVWEWQRLYNLGRAAHQVRDESDRRPMRQMQQEISHCLVDNFTKALEIADHAMQGMENSPAANAALERLCQRLQWSTGDGSFSALLDQTDGGDLIDTSAQWKLRVGDVVREDETGADVQGNWSFVAAELAHYGGKVVDHVIGYLNIQGKSPTTTDRIRWNDTAALLGYLFNELARNEYITPPQRKENGELKPNWAAVARTLHATFDIRKEKGEPVTLASLTQVLKMGGADYKSGPNHFKINQRQG